jgi:hypothetical protein
MNKFAPLIGVGVASVFLGRAALQLSDLPITSTAPAPAVGGPDNSHDGRPKVSSEARTDNSRAEPAYKALIRCLGDLDDLLDSVVNPATFATVKPLLLGRVRQHVSHAADHPGGMTKLSKAAAQEMQQAMNRHTASMLRANKVAPGVTSFFEHDVAAILNPK